MGIIDKTFCYTCRISMIFCLVTVLTSVTIFNGFQTLTYAQQTTGSTAATAAATTTTYDNQVHGIQLVYPKDWTASTSGIPAYNGIVGFYSPLENLTDILPAEITLSITTYVRPVSLDDYTSATLSALEQQGIQVEQSSSNTLAGKPGHTITFSPSDSLAGPYTQAPQQSLPTFKIMQSWTAIDNKIYLMSFTAESSKFTNYLATAQKIVDSLQITPK